MKPISMTDFVRQQHPNYNPVNRVEKRAGTQPFSGPLAVHIGAESMQSQVDRMKAGEVMTFWGEQVEYKEEEK